jgi:hypothetical protein
MMTTSNRISVYLESDLHEPLGTKIAAAGYGTNRSDFFRRLARGEITPWSWDEPDQALLIDAAAALKERCHPKATALVQEIDRRGVMAQLSPKLKELLSPLSVGLWREDVDEFIEKKETFQIELVGDWHTVLYAEFFRRGQSYELGLRLKEPQLLSGLTQSGVPQLDHNRFVQVTNEVRVKRINRDRPPWHEGGLDSISVTFRIRSTTFPTLSNVVSVEGVSTGGETWSRITQKVYNLAWFFEQLSALRPCVIESPTPIRNIHRQQLQAEIDLYG